MSHDCFGNPTPGIPPSISDTHGDIDRYSSIPFSERYEYHQARTDAMVGRGSAEHAWELLRAMDAKLGVAW